MELLPLIYFKTVAYYENMSTAAKQLHITQPALSKSIAQLEGSLGVQLFDRNGRSVKLNRYGRFFLERAEQILHDYDKAREELHNLVSPSVRRGCTWLYAYAWLKTYSSFDDRYSRSTPANEISADAK